jgi:hypothetical protein
LFLCVINQTRYNTNLLYCPLFASEYHTSMQLNSRPVEANSI